MKNRGKILSTSPVMKSRVAVCAEQLVTDRFGLFVCWVFLSRKKINTAVQHKTVLLLVLITYICLFVGLEIRLLSFLVC